MHFPFALHGIFWLMDLLWTLFPAWGWPSFPFSWMCFPPAPPSFTFWRALYTRWASSILLNASKTGGQLSLSGSSLDSPSFATCYTGLSPLNNTFLFLFSLTEMIIFTGLATIGPRFSGSPSWEIGGGSSSIISRTWYDILVTKCLFASWGFSFMPLLALWAISSWCGYFDWSHPSTFSFAPKAWSWISLPSCLAGCIFEAYKILGIQPQG